MSLIMSKNPIAAEELVNLKTPAGTDTHMPIPHATLVSYTRKALDRAGYTITEEEHGLSQGDQRYFGGFAITGRGIESDERNLVLGLRNAHNKTLASAICVGNQMIVCDNLCFSSDIKLSRKHTPSILDDLPRVISTAIARASHHFVDMGNRITSYKETEITRGQAADLLVDLVDANACPRRKWYDIVKEFEAPRHAEFKGNTLWNLYNSCTEHLKGSLDALPSRTMQMQTIFDRVAGHSPNLTVDNETGLVLPA